jgi:hypothetical protein
VLGEREELSVTARERQLMSESAGGRLAADAAPMGQAAVRPMAWAPNRLARFYAGGARVEELRDLQLGWERALAALDLSGTPPERLLVRARDTAPSEHVRELLPEVAAPYFRAQRIVTGGEPVQLEQSFAIIVVLDGWLTLWSERGDRL